jgi:lipoprotein-anchoring transpeptidase ErfK/SrfK
MSPRVKFILLISAAAACLSWTSAGAAEPTKKRSKAAADTATRLQLFLDRAQFAPGKIDGHYGEFTLRALALYRQAHGADAAQDQAKTVPQKGDAPDVSDLDLASVEPLFVDYTVTEQDLASVGKLPDSIPEQAKEKSLPYKSAAEAIAEKFHTDVDYLAELNRGKTGEIKAGAVLKVPNVEPFELTAVKDLKPGSELAGKAANEFGDDDNSAKEEPKEEKKKQEKKEESAQASTPTTSVRIDSKTNMLSVYEGEKLIGAYPVTIGSDETKSPMGDWKVSAVAKMPNFRYDEAMLQKGERSENFHMLPPGPNNPVGVIWIALNKKGIGLHGTSEPDSIGRSASHGCVRLANWDIVRLAGKVTKGVPVTIH